jgi:hypothetical protein
MRIAQKCRLHRRCAQGKYAKAVAGRVAGQVYQNVYPVGHDGPVQCRVVQRRSLAPVVGAGLGLAGVIIKKGAGVIHMHVKARPVMAQQYRQHKNIHRVLAVQVAGDIADAQALAGAAGTGKHGLRHHGRFNRRAQAAVQVGDLGAGHGIVVQRRHGHAGGDARKRVRACCKRCLQAGQMASGVAHASPQARSQQARLQVVRRERVDAAQALAAVCQRIHLRLDFGQRQQGRHTVGA